MCWEHHCLKRFFFLGATKEIRAAIGGPSPENEAEAWKALQPLVLCHEELAHNSLHDTSFYVGIKVEIVLRLF